MAKDFNLKSLNKNVAIYSKTKKVEVGGFKFVVDEQFRQTKLEAMIKDFLETYFALIYMNEEVHMGNFMHYYTLKHFTNIGDVVSGALKEKFAEIDDLDQEEMLKIKSTLDLATFKDLQDAGIFEPLFAEFDGEQVKIAFEAFKKSMDRIKEINPEEFLKHIQSETQEVEVNA